MLNTLSLIMRAIALTLLIGVGPAIGSPANPNHETPTTVSVNAMNYVRAKTALQFDKYYTRAGGINRFGHRRNVVDIDNRSSKRLNRDTLYSFAIVDISKGAVVEMPDAGDRYMSLQVMNEDGYTNVVIHGSGRYELTQEEFHTPFVWLLVRTLISTSIENDIDIAHSLQDQLAIESLSERLYHHVSYDIPSFNTTTDLLVELGKGLTDNSKSAGSAKEVDAIKHLITSAYGFGTLPETESFLLVVQPNLPSDNAYVLNIDDVPVDGFWSLAMYNEEGYFEKNEFESYGYSDQTAEKNPDGSISLHLGGDPSSVNYIPLPDGWNYVVRLYRPRGEVLDGSWLFPAIERVGSSGK